MTYTEEMKTELLGVAPAYRGGGSRQRGGSGSDACRRMTPCGAEFGVTTTGFAGPAAARRRPVGLVWPSLAARNGKKKSGTVRFSRDTERNT